MGLCKLNIFLILIFINLFAFTNTALGFSPIEDGVYSNYTNANSVHKDTLTRTRGYIPTFTIITSNPIKLSLKEHQHRKFFF